MKAAVLTAHGEPPAYAEHPDPTATDGHVLVRHDHVRLFEMGAHPFLTLTLFIAMFERDHGPLEYQIAYGQAMAHL